MNANDTYMSKSELSTENFGPTTVSSANREPMVYELIIDPEALYGIRC